jgi:hypothetical protein
MPQLLHAPRAGTRVRPLPGGRRLIDFRRPHLVDAVTRNMVGVALHPLPARRVSDMFTLADRISIVVEPGDQIGGWTAYSVLHVHRHSVMWVHAAVAPRPGAARTVAGVLAVQALGEWVRRGGRPLYVAGTSRRAATVAVSRRLGLDHLREALASWMTASRWASPLAPDAGYESVGHVVRDALAGPVGAGAGAGAEPAGPGRLGPRDAHLVVVRASARQLGRYLASRRRAPAA